MIRLALAIVVAALISSFLDPTLGFSASSLATFLGFVLALAVVLICFEVPALLEHRRVHGEVGRLRVLPWALILAAIFVVVSRLADLQPGYLWGVVLGVVFMRPPGERDEGREQAAGAVFTLAIAVGAWIVLGWLRGVDGPALTFGSHIAETALAAIVVSGLEAVAIGLLPFRFMPGAAVYRWSRLAWGILLGFSLFAFIHILIGPTSGYITDLSKPGWVAAMAVFAAFGALTVLFWAWFRFRPASESESSSDGIPSGQAG